MGKSYRISLDCKGEKEKKHIKSAFYPNLLGLVEEKLLMSAYEVN